MSWRTIVALAVSALVLSAYLVARQALRDDEAPGANAGRIFAGLNAELLPREPRHSVGGDMPVGPFVTWLDAHTGVYSRYNAK